MILHCMTKSLWDERKNKDVWGHRELAAEGFIHCSPVEYFWRVAPNFKDTDEELILLCLDESKLQAEIRYEDGDNCGRFYPHIYGPINNDAVTAVLPFIKDNEGTYIKNPQLAHIEDK